MDKENRNEEVDNNSEYYSTNFIEAIINKDIEEGKRGGRINTRFPPEPNGYLHIGHAKAICLNFGISLKYGGKCNLRFDDTNPSKEDVEFAESIKEDINWLGFKWDNLFFASDYFDDMYNYAVKLIKKDKAFVCDLTADEMREYRGNFNKPGNESPYRNRSIEENLELFEKMKNGDFADGEKVLRAKIDMTSPNINMRDPVIYRIAKVPHYRQGDRWCIYPMYDYAHPIEDAIEGITHSLCSLEFEDHRPLYDWVINAIGEWVDPPQQIEFARLDITNTLMSKRYIRKLVEEGNLMGWGDPRLHTLSGLRRRGYTAKAIRNFCDEIGIAKSNSTVDIAMLEHFIREDLKFESPRYMAVLDPIKVVITNYPENVIEYLDVENNPENPDMGSRKVPFSREIYIEREDFMENPDKKFFRLFPNNEVRLRNAYFIVCNEVIKDENGEVTELRCTYDKETKSGTGFVGRKVKGTLHWVSVEHSIDAEVRLFDYLMVKKSDSSEYEFNENSMTILKKCKLEHSFDESKPGDKYQFLRHGYFVEDIKDSTVEYKVFNRIVEQKSSWKK